MRGFTLLELLTALAIFALLSTMGYTGLQTVLQAQAQHRQQAEAFAELTRALTLLQQDLEQAINRPVRDRQGDPVAALVGGQDAAGLELTRSGWLNPQRSPVPALQRVGWRLADGRLLRLSWPVLDRAPDTGLVDVPMLEHVEQLGLRFLDREGAWHPSWPAGNNALPLPVAVEVTAQVEPWGTVRRLFRVPGP